MEDHQSIDLVADMETRVSRVRSSNRWQGRREDTSVAAATPGGGVAGGAAGAAEMVPLSLLGGSPQPPGNSATWLGVLLFLDALSVDRTPSHRKINGLRVRSTCG
jgi:hypothetical protein